MKIYLYILPILLYFFSLLTADEIYLKDSKIIKGKVLRITEKNVEYSEENGLPFLIVPTDQVLKIEYDSKKEN